jgi:threonine dehydratase
VEVRDKVIVVTGGASGIGRAMAERFHAEGAKKVVVADLDGEGAQTVAGLVDGWAKSVDVSDESQIVSLIEETEAQFGPIDLFCSNAGIGLGKGLDELHAARVVVASIFAPTPQYNWPLLAQRCGIDVWVKHENHTPTGSFKARGGLVYLDGLEKRNALPKGLITATRGNHGQSIPFAAGRYGVPVTVVVPEGNSVEKNKAMQAWGADLIVHGSDFDVARVESQRMAAEQGLTFAPSFHPDLVRGVATYAYELLTQVPDLHTVYVPIGMGSGVCAVVTVRDLLGLDTRVVGVVSAEAPAYALSFEAGKVVQTNEARTFADGVACRVPDPQALEIILGGVERIVRVSDNQVADAIRVLYEDTHNVAEGAGAAALAALLSDLDTVGAEKFSGRPVAVVQTGGNIDSSVLAEVLSGKTPQI